MGAGLMPITPEQRAHFESLGQAHVRIIAERSGFGGPAQPAAQEWLAELEDTDRARSEASQASQMRTALSANRAAWIAAIAAIAAAVIAIIGIIVTVLTWLFPRH